MPFPDGRHLVYWNEEDRLIEEIAKFSKKDAENYWAYDAFVERACAVMDQFIRLERRAVSGRTEVDPGFAVLVVTDGQLTIQDTVLHWGTIAVAPYAAYSAAA